METLSLHLCRSVIVSAFTENGLMLIDATPTIYVYDYNLLFEAHSNLEGFASYVHRYEHHIALSHDGQYALFCDTQKQRVLYIDAIKRKLLANIKYSKGPNFAIFSAKSELFMISNSVGNIGIYSTAEQELIAQFPFPDEISHATFSNDLSKVAIASCNKKIYIYSVESQTILKTIELEEIVEALCFSRNDNSLLGFSRDGNSMVYNLSFEQLFRATPHSEWPTTLTLSSTKELALLGTRGCELYLYTTSKGNKLGSVVLEHWGITSISIADKRVFIGFSNGNGVVLDLQVEIALAIKHLQKGDIATLSELCYEYPLVFISTQLSELIHKHYEKIISFKAQTKEQKIGFEALVSMVMENDSIKESLLTKLYQSPEIIPFMEKVEQGDFDGACKVTYQHPILRQLREFNELRTMCNKNISEEIKVLESNPQKFLEYRKNKTHNCQQCEYGIMPNAEVVGKNFLQFEQSAKAKNFTTMIEIINNFPVFKQTRLYRRLMNDGEALIDKILLMMQSNHIAEAEKYAIKLSQIKPFMQTGVDFKEQIKNFVSFDQACRNQDSIKIFSLAMQNPALRTTKNFKSQLLHYEQKYHAAKVQAILGDPKGVITILGDYLKIDYFQEENNEVMRLALVHEIEKYAPKADQKKLLDTYHEYFGWDEGYQSVCDILKVVANTIKKLEPIAEVYTTVQTLITGERVTKKNIEQKDKHVK